MISRSDTNAAYDYAPSDALGRAYQSNHNNPYAAPGYPSGVNSVIYRSYGAERDEVMLDRTYTGGC